MIPYKQSYVHTCSPNVSKANEHYQHSIFTHTQNCLISLIHGLNSPSFGIQSLNKGIRDISRFKNDYLKPNDTFYIDSGGYSIISGEVGIGDIPRFINMYDSALRNVRGLHMDSAYDIDTTLNIQRQVIDQSTLPDNYDFIFSLDIPFFINSPAANTTGMIYKFNKESLTSSINAIIDNPELRDKFLFVLQWKMPKQFAIWDKLYNELELYKHHKYFAVGGMVGLSSFVNLQFAPFIVPLYYQLYYYMKHSNHEYAFYSHLLGIYHKPFRFILYFMQAIFKRYFGNDKAFITYDTINWSISAMYKSRVGMEFYNVENGHLKQYDSHHLPDALLEDVYLTDNCRSFYDKNLKAIENNDKLTDTSFLIPLNIRSQLSLDEFFKQYIEKHNMVDILLKHSNNPITFKIAMSAVINNMLQYPGLTTNFTKSVWQSCSIILSMHNWLQHDRDNKDAILVHMDRFIKRVNFPFDLEETL